MWLPADTHVAYLDHIDSGDCPATHPHHFPHLSLELTYNVASIDQSDGGRFLLSQGDPTGYGFHGSFFHGWDETALTNALAGGDNSCIADRNDRSSSCSALQKTVNLAATRTCPEFPPALDEKGESSSSPHC